MIILFTSLNTADLSDVDLDGPLMLLDMAFYMYLSTVVAKIYGALWNTSAHNWDEDFIRSVALRMYIAVHYSMRPPEQMAFRNWLWYTF